MWCVSQPRGNSRQKHPAENRRDFFLFSFIYCKLTNKESLVFWVTTGAALTQLGIDCGLFSGSVYNAGVSVQLPKKISLQCIKHDHFSYCIYPVIGWLSHVRIHLVAAAEVEHSLNLNLDNKVSKFMFGWLFICFNNLGWAFNKQGPQ